MLQRLPWIPHNNLTSASPLRISSNTRISLTCRAYHAHRVSHQGLVSVCPSGAHNSLTCIPRRMSTKSAFSYESHKPAASARRVEKAQQYRKTRSIEPWIRPHSLSESLEAHRQANRDGLARDGVPTTPAPNRGRNLVARRQPLTSRPGIKRLDIVKHTAPGGDADRISATCPHLSSEWRPSKALPYLLRLPWTSALPDTGANDTVESSLERLNSEIIACGAYLSPTAYERRAALDAFEEIKSSLTNHLSPGAEIQLVGSRVAGTEGPLSDLDVNIRFESEMENADDVLLARTELKNLSVAIRSRHYHHRLRIHVFVNAATVPVIVGTHLPSGLEFQVQSTSDAFDSLEVTRAFVAEYPVVCVLFRVVKQILNMRGLGKGSTGGLTSYPLLNMIVTSLKLANPRLRFDSVAAQLLNFLDFWSDINLDQHGIELTTPSGPKMQPANTSVDPISAVPHLVLRQHGAKAHKHPMLLRDPANLSNNLGRAANRIHHVQACFIEARERIRIAMQHWDDNMGRGLPPKHRHLILGWCLQGDYSSFEEARSRLRAYGKHSTQLHK